MKLKPIICKACNKEIIFNKERCVHIEDWNCGTFDVDSWWHLKCFISAMNRDLAELEKKASIMLDQAKLVYSKLPKEMTTEEYII